MQHTRRRIIAMAAFAGSLAVLALAGGVAQAAIHGASGTFRCKGSAEYGPWSPVSDGPNSYIIGNCAPGTIIGRTYYELQVQNGPYFGGYIGGNFNGCGAVQTQNLEFRRVSADRTSFCNDPKRGASKFALVTDCRDDTPNKSAPCRAWDPLLHGDEDTVVVKDCQAYANVRPFGISTTPLDPVQHISPTISADPSRPGRFKVWWRYVTRDARYVLVHDTNGVRTGNPAWVFVAGGCVRSPHAPMRP